MARLAVLAGRTISDFFRNIWSSSSSPAWVSSWAFAPEELSSLTFRPVILMLFFAYCLSWGFASSVSRRRTLKPLKL